MKRRLLFIASVVVSFPLAAQQQYSAPGCGLGSKLFEGQSGVGPHVLAATTNGFYGTQTFAMTSGTLGCDTSQPIISSMAMNLIDGDMDRVAAAIATAHGDSLVALADAFGIDEMHRQTFNQTLQENFKRIYPSTDVSSVDVYETIVRVMREKPELSGYVS